MSKDDSDSENTDRMEIWQENTTVTDQQPYVHLRKILELAKTASKRLWCIFIIGVSSWLYNFDDIHFFISLNKWTNKLLSSF